MDHSWDIFRTYPLRFAGYGFGLSEALRGPALPTLVRGLQTMGSCFIFAHTLYKPFQVSKRTQSPTKIVMWTADTFVYEILASGAMPVFTASLVKSAMSSILHAKSSPGSTRLWAPAIVSMMSLPLIVPFTDASLDTLMNLTVRQFYN